MLNNNKTYSDAVDKVATAATSAAVVAGAVAFGLKAVAENDQFKEIVGDVFSYLKDNLSKKTEKHSCQDDCKCSGDANGSAKDSNSKFDVQTHFGKLLEKRYKAFGIQPERLMSDRIKESFADSDIYAAYCSALEHLYYFKYIRSDVYYVKEIVVTEKNVYLFAYYFDFNDTLDSNYVGEAKLVSVKSDVDEQKKYLEGLGFKQFTVYC